MSFILWFPKCYRMRPDVSGGSERRDLLRRKKRKKVTSALRSERLKERQGRGPANVNSEGDGPRPRESVGILSEWRSENQGGRRRRHRKR